MGGEVSASSTGEDDKERIRAEGRALGFDAVGFASTDPSISDAANLRQYLAENRHGGMGWMETTADRRASLTELWPEARSAICCAVNYGPDENPLAVLENPDVGAISVYARGDDYHRVIKSRLKAFARWLSSTFGSEVKVFVDTAPIMEKPLAMRAGLGWIGKHTNLVSRAFGSWLFLGEILTTLVIKPDAPEIDHCGRCDACLRACPTGALDEPYQMDARRCISYLTIEHKEDIDPALARDMGNRVFGCDDCLAVCPWNKFSTEHTDPGLRARDSLKRPLLSELQQLDETTFKELFVRTSIRRTGVVRFARNTRIAIKNRQKNSSS
jgi:epoxyqueuosine reductase